MPPANFSLLVPEAMLTSSRYRPTVPSLLTAAV
jgi:hypothetical protein